MRLDVMTNTRSSPEQSFSCLLRGDEDFLAPGYFPTSYIPESKLNFLSQGNAVSDRPTPKTQAREIIEALPDSASWEDVMYAFYVRESIEKGLADSESGRTVPHAEVRMRLRELLRRSS